MLRRCVQIRCKDKVFHLSCSLVQWEIKLKTWSPWRWLIGASAVLPDLHPRRGKKCGVCECLRSPPLNDMSSVKEALILYLKMPSVLKGQWNAGRRSSQGPHSALNLKSDTRETNLNVTCTLNSAYVFRRRRPDLKHPWSKGFWLDFLINQTAVLQQRDAAAPGAEVFN